MRWKPVDAESRNPHGPFLKKAFVGPFLHIYIYSCFSNGPKLQLCICVHAHAEHSEINTTYQISCPDTCVVRSVSHGRWLAPECSLLRLRVRPQEQGFHRFVWVPVNFQIGLCNSLSSYMFMQGKLGNDLQPLAHRHALCSDSLLVDISYAQHTSFLVTLGSPFPRVFIWISTKNAPSDHQHAHIYILIVELMNAWD